MISKQTLNTVILLAPIVAFFFFVYSYTQEVATHNAINCSSVLSFEHEKPDITQSFDITFQLLKNNKGVVNLFGRGKHSGGENIISRTIEFDYTEKAKGTLTLKNMKYSKNIRDTMSDDLFRSFFFFVPQGASRQININRINNAVLISNLNSPVFICVDRNI